jgi:hypothetical protein
MFEPALAASQHEEGVDELRLVPAGIDRLAARRPEGVDGDAGVSEGNLEDGLMS